MGLWASFDEKEKRNLKYSTRAARPRGWNMFGFLRRAISTAGAYSEGKAYEKASKLAQLSTMIYLHEQCESDDTKRVAVWSYLFCTEPSDPGIIQFREQAKDEIADTATQLLDADEPFREIIVCSLWVALAVARSRDNRADFERILSSSVFKQYSATYPMLPHDRYSALVQEWSRKYSPIR
jgi:hypothetical protein